MYSTKKQATPIFLMVLFKKKILTFKKKKLLDNYIKSLNVYE